MFLISLLGVGDAATREKLGHILAPFKDQQNRVLIANKAKRKDKDINPVTGEENEHEDETPAPTSTE